MIRVPHWWIYDICSVCMFSSCGWSGGWTHSPYPWWGCHQINKQVDMLDHVGMHLILGCTWAHVGGFLVVMDPRFWTLLPMTPFPSTWQNCCKYSDWNLQSPWVPPMPINNITWRRAAPVPVGHAVSVKGGIEIPPCTAFAAVWIKTYQNHPPELSESN